MANSDILGEQADRIHSEKLEVSSAGSQTTGVREDSSLASQDAEARGNMYLFFSSVYLRPPTPELIRHIVDTHFLDSLSSLFGSKTVADLSDYAATIHSDDDLSILKQEYMDLFAAPTGRYVIPFEDIYQGERTDDCQERGPLMGVQAVSVRRMYREAGAEMDQSCKELPTHIGVELSFMGFLCEREAAARRIEAGEELPDQETEQLRSSASYRELQIRFLRNHLNTWFPQLSQAIQANAKSQFYRGLAQITQAFLAQDTARLQTQTSSEHHPGV